MIRVRPKAFRFTRADLPRHLLFDPVLAGCCRNHLSSLVSLTSMASEGRHRLRRTPHSWWMAGKSEVIHFDENALSVDVRPGLCMQSIRENATLAASGLSCRSNTSKCSGSTTPDWT